ncbi:MAG: T9SS type A sorting domain-containing protein [bacterium]|nr:T9SS type A sorting domain-containing protein [bacterium]
MSRKLTLIALCGGLLLALAGLAHAHAGTPQFARIDAALDAGVLDAEQALLYKFYYVFDPQKLPADYVPETAGPIKCVTPLLIEFESLRDKLSRDTVTAIEAMVAPEAADKATYISPSGRFRLTYLTTGTNRVPTADTNPANGIPDYVERCASYLDTSWTTEITNLGFTAPPLAPYYEVSFENMDAYGYTSVVSGTRTRITLENDYVGFPANDDPDGDVLGAAKVTCAHEFKHASQRATSSWTEGGWVELDATWAEDVVYDATNDFYNYLPAGSGITAPTSSLDTGGTGSYEDCIWQIVMSETWGNQVIVDFWNWRHLNTTQSVMDSYSAILSMNGSSLGQFFAKYAAWNYATRSKALAGIGYGEAATFPNSSATAGTTYPFVASGTIAHLSAKPYHFTGFTAGEPGQLRVQFDGGNLIEFGLVAVIKKNDGTGVYETIPLNPSTQAADYLLSVPLAQIASVGLIISNTDISTNNVAWDLTVSKKLPAATLQISPTDVAITLEPDVMDADAVQLTNVGLAGSVLDYTTYVMGQAPALKSARPVQAVAGAGRGVSELARAELMSATRYTGDCLFGNNDTAGVQGYYSTWWAGLETYATRINPADYACSCDPGFNVRAIHMLLYLETTSAPQVQVHLAAAGADCTTPGAILESSSVVNISGIAAAGYYDIEVPCDFECQDMTGSYFLMFEFLNSAGPVGIPVDAAGQACVNYNDWGEGYADVVSEYGFAGDWLIWADVDCCGVPTPTVSVVAPNGGEILQAGDSAAITWTATVMTEVKIEISRNGGGAWDVLLASTPNDGSQTVTVDGPATQNALIRVSSLDNLYSDVSDAPFMIYETVPWLSVTPQTGSLTLNETDQLNLLFDTAGMADGEYTAYLVIESNTASSLDVVPVVLTVFDPNTGAGDAPRVFRLDGNAPNPFNPMTTVSFSLATAGRATVDVLDLQGRVVRTLFAGDLPAGVRALVWDGRDDAGREVASGAYLARLQSGGRTATHKMILAR